MVQNSRKPNEPFLWHLGNAIRDRRIELLISQAELGARAGLHRTYVTDIENGNRNTSIITLMRVAAGLQCDLSRQILTAEKAMRKCNNS